jgi:hypothetical protein
VTAHLDDTSLDRASPRVRPGIADIDPASAVAGHAEERRRDACTAVEGLPKSNEERRPERRHPLRTDLSPVATYSRPEPLAIPLRVLHAGVLASRRPAFGPRSELAVRSVEIGPPSLRRFERSGEGPQIRRRDTLLRAGDPSESGREVLHFHNDYDYLRNVILRALSCRALFRRRICRSDADFLRAGANDREILTRTVMDLGRSAMMPVSVDDIEAIRSMLAALPPTRPKQLTKQKAIASLASELGAAQRRGYTADDLARLISEKGIAVNALALKNYLRENRKPRKGERRAVTRASENSTGGSTPPSVDRPQPADAQPAIRESAGRDGNAQGSQTEQRTGRKVS